MKKKLLFITGTLNIGGIETYIARLSKHLADDLKVSVLILSKKGSKNLIDEVQKYADVYFLNDYVKIYGLSKINSSYFNVLIPIDYARLYSNIGDLDYIHAVDSLCNVVGLEFLKLNNNIRLTTGVYHSQEYLWKTNHYFRKVQRNLFLTFPNRNILNCNEKTINDLSLHLSKNFIGSPVIPIGIDIINYKNSNPSFRSNKIISIGRLVDFKTYNKHIIQELDDINLDGYELEYHIYGDGSEKEELQKIAMSKKSKIFFHGTIEYQDMPKVLNDAFVFIGSGTAIIEASAAGIPSIIGIESEDHPLTYGLFSNLSGYSYNENDLDIPKIAISELIIDLKRKSQNSYLDISNQHRNKAEEFSIFKSKNKFPIFLLEAKKLQFSYNRLHYKISLFYWLLLNTLRIKDDKKTRYNKSVLCEENK